MQHSLFPPKICDDFGPLGNGVTRPRMVRADDGLLYVIKADSHEAPTCRASEFLWLSIARVVGLPVPTPTVIADASGDTFVGMRYEAERIRDHQLATFALLNGQAHNAGEQLAKIFAFDLFCGNWDRHFENYLVLESHGQLVVMAIDFSHVLPNTGQISHSIDPILVTNCATRGFFPIVAKPYLPDAHARSQACGAATKTLDRIEKISDNAINEILGNFPADWLAQAARSEIAQWWSSQARVTRVDQLRTGMKNGSYI